MVRVVAVRPRCRNEELVTMTVDPFPDNLVSFHNIQEVLQESLVDHMRVKKVDIQPCHLGQAFMHFTFLHDL